MEDREIKKQYSRLQERSASTMTQMERTQRLLDRIRCESARKSSEMDKLQHEFSSLGDRIRALENKAMEVEKLEISVETLKKNLDSTQQEIRDKEREIRQLQRTLEIREKELSTSETKVESLERTNHDLKLQVRQEIKRATELEMKIENTDRLKEDVDDKQHEIDSLKREVEEKLLLAQHARKCLREERHKCKKLEDDNHDMDAMKEEVELVTSENQTLKRLLAAKDVVVHQRSQTVENLKNILSDHVTTEEYEEILHDLQEQQSRVKVTKQQRASSNSHRSGDRGRSKHFEDRKGLGSTFPRSSRPQSSGSHLFKTILNGDHDSGDERDTSPRARTAVVRPHVYDSFSDFRSNSPTSSDVTSINSSTTCNSSGKWRDANHLRRSQSLRVSSFSGSRSSVTSSVEHLNGWVKNEDRGHVRQNGAMDKSNMVVQSDAKLASYVKSGDRVVFDISKKKGSGKDLHTGLVKYVGHLEGDKDTYRVFVGLKLDGPDGDTDGLYKGKRYFRVSPCHGKFVRIQKILSVFDKQSGSYRKLEDLVAKSHDNGSQHVFQSSKH